VTADGKAVTASEQENPELFWGIRGGGGNFGVATALEFDAVPIGTEVYSGVIVKRFSDLKKFTQFYRDYVRTLPDEMTVWMVIRKAPPMPFLSPTFMANWFRHSLRTSRSSARQSSCTATRHRGNASVHTGMTPWVGWQSRLDVLVPPRATLEVAQHDALADSSVQSPIPCRAFGRYASSDRTSKARPDACQNPPRPTPS
jgi:hypothetical protein